MLYALCFMLDALCLITTTTKNGVDKPILYQRAMEPGKALLMEKKNNDF